MKHRLELGSVDEPDVPALGEGLGILGEPAGGHDKLTDLGEQGDQHLGHVIPRGTRSRSRRRAGGEVVEGEVGDRSQ